MRPTSLPVVLVTLLALARPLPAQDTTAEASFRAFLPRYQAALEAMIIGDDTAWLAMLSRNPTLFTAFGGIRTGREDVERRYRWAAGGNRQHVESTVDLQVVRLDVHGDVAAMAALEVSRNRLAGQDTVLVGYTRVTSIFLREAGEWKLAHRHMDHLQEDGPPPDR